MRDNDRRMSVGAELGQLLKSNIRDYMMYIALIVIMGYFTYMTAGAFIQGSSIELSSDAPIRPPYIVYFQGGLTYDHSRFGVIMSLDRLYKKGLLKNLG